MTLFQVTYGINREGQEDVVAAASRTHCGMAHFAGTGPAGKTCRECAYWRHRSRWTRAHDLTPSEPVPARCMRFTELTLKRGEAVPHDAEACKQFVQSDRPQPLKRPEKEYERA